MQKIKAGNVKTLLHRNAGMAYIEDKTLQAHNQWFCEYVDTFCTDQSEVRENILLKKHHTKRVCDEILRIGRNLGLSENSLRLAIILALFHDVGRFDQFARYRTFVDQKSENHAELSVKILKKHNVLKDLEDSMSHFVYRVISYHNRPFLPDGETKMCLFYTKLLRDADKLDIWRVLTDYYRRKNGDSNSAIELGLPDTSTISDNVVNAIRNKRIVDIHHIQTLNDFKVLQIGWIFDVNFQITMDTIIARNYIDHIIGVLPNSGEVNIIKKIVNQYIEKDFVEEAQRINI